MVFCRSLGSTFLLSSFPKLAMRSWGRIKNSSAADYQLICWSESFSQKISKQLGKAMLEDYTYHREF